MTKTWKTMNFWCFFDFQNYFFGSFDSKSLFGSDLKPGSRKEIIIFLLRNSKSGIMFWKFMKKMFKASYRMFEADTITNLFIYSFILRWILVNSHLPLQIVWHSNVRHVINYRIFPSLQWYRFSSIQLNAIQNRIS